MESVAIPSEDQCVLCRLIVLVDRNPSRIDFEVSLLVELVSQWNEQLETDALVTESQQLTSELTMSLIQV